MNDLVEAAGNGDFKKVQALLSSGVDVNQCHAHSGFRPLIAAAANGHVHIVVHLLEKGAGIDLLVDHPWPTEHRGDTALMLASEKGHLEIVDVLLAHGANVNFCFALREPSALSRAARHGQPHVVKRLLEAKATLRPIDLFFPTASGHIAVLRLLIKAGAPVNTTNNGEPLILQAIPLFPSSEAVVCRKIKVLQLLLEAGAKINARSNTGDTVLIRASRNNVVKMIPFLIAAGADVNQADNAGQTPLHGAAENGWLGIVKILVKAGACLDVKDKRGETPFDLAKYYRKKDVVSFLKPSKM